MSHSQTITGSRTALNTQYSSLNSSVKTYLTLPVALKAVQVVVGIACVWISGEDLLDNFNDLATLSAAVVVRHTKVSLGRLLEALEIVLGMVPNHELLFKDQMTCRIIYLTVSSIFLVISLIQITWFPASLFTGPLKSRIISGVVYHLIGFGLHLVASLNLIARIELMEAVFFNNDLMWTVGIIGLVNSALYLASAILALWSFVENRICGTKSSGGRRRALSTQSLPAKTLPKQ